VVKVDLADPMSGFFMIRREAFEAAVHDLSNQGYKILLDVIASSPQPPRIKEVSYTFRSRQHGESKLDALVTLEYISLLLDKLWGKWIPVRFVLFAGIGGLGVVFHMVVLTLLLSVGKVSFAVGQSVATLAAMTFNFFVNNTLTYRDRRLKGLGPLLRGLLTFCIICSVGAVANVGIANVLFVSDYSWWLSALAGILLGAVWNYGVTSIFTWRK
jgi:dolichol-phosphate mannosyltransferase